MTVSGALMGRRPCLVVVDVQKAAVAAGPFQVDRVLENIAALLSAARKSGAEVVFVQHDGEPGESEEPHTPGWEIHPAVAPEGDEPVFRKRFNSAFRETELHSYLQTRGVDALIIVGIQTEYCVDTSVRVAFELGYTVVLPEMTNTTFDNGAVSAQEIYEMFNHRIFADRFASVIPVGDVLQALG
ncbi:MAG: cysteine hydrolase [Gemmatimonadota bacterium]|nr:cysteine hydrolase [Gemmatimonadota bacterium]